MDSQSQLSLYSRCCPLLYRSQPAGSISSGPQLTLTGKTHFVDPRSGSSVTLGHSAPDNNTRDVISNGISVSRTVWTPPHISIQPVFYQCRCRCRNNGVFTARNEVGARLYFYRRLWFCSRVGGGSAPTGGSAPGGVPAPGGCLLPGGVPALGGGGLWRPPPSWLLLQAVRILLGCILVHTVFTLAETEA